jgi:hypothetical protein
MRRAKERAQKGQSLLELAAREGARAMRSREVRPNRAEARVAASNAAWARRFGLVSDDLSVARHAAIRCGSFAAHTYPSAPPAVVELGADLITWLFLFDDRYGEGLPQDDVASMRARFATYERTLRSGELPEDPSVFHRALLDLRARALTLANEDWLDRFADSFQLYFEGCLLELPFRRAGRPPNVEQYRQLRAWSIGGFPVFDLIELASGVLTHEEAALPELKQLREATALLCAWVNDIYSFPKERSDKEPLNLVSVLEWHYGLDSNDALGAASEVFNTDLDVFEYVSDIIREKRPSPALVAYLDGLDDWVHGNCAWTGLSGRYQSA